MPTDMLAVNSTHYWPHPIVGFTHYDEKEMWRFVQVLHLPLLTSQSHGINNWKFTSSYSLKIHISGKHNFIILETLWRPNTWIPPNTLILILGRSSDQLILHQHKTPQCDTFQDDLASYEKHLICPLFMTVYKIFS